MLSDLTGKLLIAMPGIGDSRFSRSLVLICAHEPEYAMGIVLNKPMDDLTLPQLLSQLGIEQDIKLPDDAVLSGGPVGTDRGFVVHTGDFHCEGATLDISHDFCLTATRDAARARVAVAQAQLGELRERNADLEKQLEAKEVEANATEAADTHPPRIGRRADDAP